MITRNLLLTIPVLLLFPVYGFMPTSHQNITPPSMQLATAAATRRHQLDGPAAFASPSPSRLSFTPKEDNNEASEGGEKPFIRPALHNSPFFRSLAILYALLFAIYQGSTAPSASANNALQKVGKYFMLSPKAAATVHLLSFATWFGTVVYTTFVTGITMFKNLPRRVFGTLQSKLFPLYFQLCSVMIGVQVSSLILMDKYLYYY